MLDRILLSRFRNHGDTALEGTAQFNLLVGENGAGKTNVLESVSLLAPGRGLRRAQIADMPAQTGDGGFAVSCSHDRSLRVWERTRDMVFLEEERENKRRKTALLVGALLVLMLSTRQALGELVQGKNTLSLPHEVLFIPRPDCLLLSSPATELVVVVVGSSPSHRESRQGYRDPYSGDRRHISIGHRLGTLPI